MKKLIPFQLFCRERHAVYERRAAGEPQPWTRDPIIASTKFCNVFRDLDRMTIYSRDVVVGSHDDGERDKIFRALAFRLFCRIETWTEFVRICGGRVTVKSFRKSYDAIDRRLNEIHDAGDPIFTGAYQVNQLIGVPGTTASKWLRNLATIVEREFLEDAVRATRLAQVRESLLRMKIRSLGDFTATQVSLDVNAVLRLPIVAAWPGLGAKNALRMMETSPTSAGVAVVRDAAARELPLYNGRRMSVVDVEHALCEWYKYERLKEKWDYDRERKPFKPQPPLAVGRTA